MKSTQHSGDDVLQALRQRAGLIPQASANENGSGIASTLTVRSQPHQS